MDARNSTRIFSSFRNSDGSLSRISRLAATVGLVCFSIVFSCSVVAARQTDPPDSFSRSSAVSATAIGSPVTTASTDEFLIMYVSEGQIHTRSPIGGDDQVLGPELGQLLEFTVKGNADFYEPNRPAFVTAEPGWVLLHGVTSDDGTQALYLEGKCDVRQKCSAEFRVSQVAKSGARKELLSNISAPVPDILFDPIYWSGDTVLFDTWNPRTDASFLGLWKLDVASQRYEKLDLGVGGYNSRPLLSPDGRSLLFTGFNPDAALKVAPFGTPSNMVKLLSLNDYTTRIVLVRADNDEYFLQGWIKAGDVSSIAAAALKAAPESTDDVPEATSGFQRPFTNAQSGYVYKEWSQYSCGWVYHPGWDYNGPNGCDADLGYDVHAVATGHVVYRNTSNWGGMVVQHLYQGQTYYSQYGHISEGLKAPGENVSKDDHIAEVGKVGASCAHLHWEIRESDHPNPTKGDYWDCSVLSNESKVDEYYEDPQWFVDNHGAYGSANYDPPSGYTRCAYEGERCSFSGTKNVRYGVNGTFTDPKTYTNGVDCNNSNFTDLVPGVKKACYTQDVSGGGTWRAEYYDSEDMWWDRNNYSWHACGEDLPGPTLNIDYGSRAPCGGMRNNGDHWVGDYNKKVNFPAGKYVFYSDHDDGAKLIIEGVNNGNPIMEAGGKENTKVCNGQDGFYLSGEKNVRVILHEEGGDAKVTLSWDTNTAACVPPKPAAPTLRLPENNSTKPSNYDLTFEWNSVSGATDYYLEWGGGPYSQAMHPCEWTSGTSCHIGQIYAGYSYYWKVKARNGAGDGDWSDTWQFTIQAQQQKPAAPTLRLPENNSTKPSNYDLTFEWNSVSNATGYYLEWWGGPYDQAMHPCEWTSATSCHIGQIYAGYSYYWKVKARNGAGDGDWSDTWQFTIQSQNQPPNAPSDLRVAGTTSSSITLQWTDNADNETGYKIFRWDGSGFAYLASAGANATSYADNGRPCNHDDYYEVAAYNNYGESGHAGWVKGTTAACACYSLTRTHTGSGADPTANPANSDGCPAGQYLSGAAVTLTAAPASSWRVSNWWGTDADGSSATTNRVTMLSTNRTVGVNYTQDQSRLTCSSTALFSDSYADASTGLTVWEYQTVVWAYDGGEYEMFHAAPGWQSWAVYPFPFSAYSVAVDVHRHSGSASDSQGLIFGVDLNNARSFYAFEVRSGQFRLWTQEYSASTAAATADGTTNVSQQQAAAISGADGEVQTTLIDWTPNSAIRDAGQVNRLEVRRRGGQIDLYANNTYLATANDSRFAGNLGIGLFANSWGGTTGNSNFRFDNLAVNACTASESCANLTMNASPSGSGSVRATLGANCSDGRRYVSETVVQLNATASSGYRFASWSGALSGADTPAWLSVGGGQNVTANFERVGSGGDAYEPDDTAAQANVIYHNQPQTHSIQPAADVDWVKFVLNEWSGIVLATRGDAGDTVMSLYDASLSQIASNDDSPGAGNFSFIGRWCGGNSLAPGVYYAKVNAYPGSAAISSYTLLFSAYRCSQPDGLVHGFVARFYQRCLEREPDYDGLEYWASRLLSGELSAADLANGFVLSSEFRARNLPDLAYLQVLYRAFFNREPDSGGLNWWLNKLQGGMARSEVLDSFIHSEEFRQLSQAYGIKPYNDGRSQVEAFVTRFYQQCLGRAPESAGLQYWTDALISGSQSGADVARSFILSPEFIRRGTSNDTFLNILYRAFLDREPDAGGKAWWLARMSEGMSREDVVYNFTHSPEFGTLCQRYHIRPY